MERIDYLKTSLLNFYKTNFEFQEVYVKNNQHQSSKLLIVCSQIGYFLSGTLIVLLTILSAGEFYSYTCLIALLTGSMFGLKCGIQVVNKTLYLPSEKFEQRRNRKFKDFLRVEQVSEEEKKLLIDYFEYTIARIKTRPVSSKILMFIIGSFIPLFTLAINIYAKDNVEVSHSIFVLGIAGIFFLTGMWFTINAFIESFMNRNVARMRNIVEALRYS